MLRKQPEIIVAVDEEGGFGKDGMIPWQLPEDLKHFKELTEGNVCVMGRITFDNILDMRVARDAKNDNHSPIAEILPNRDSFVVTSDTKYPTPGATRVEGLGSVIDQMSSSRDQRKLFVIGGRRLFIQAMSWNPIIHMTIVKGPTYNCDVFFPVEVLNKKYKIVSGKETDKAYYVVYQTR